MIYDWLTYVMAGFQDLFSPVQLAVPGLVLFFLFVFSATPRFVLVLFTGQFFVAYVLTSAMFDAGFSPAVWNSDVFMEAASWFYCLVGVLFVWMAFLCGRHWQRLVNDSSLPVVPLALRLSMPVFLVGWLAVLLGVLLAACGTLWPITMHMVLQGAYLFSGGRFFESLGCLGIYELVRNAGVVVLFIIVLLARRSRLSLLRENKSLVVIILAAFYLAIGVSLVYFHFNRV